MAAAAGTWAFSLPALRKMRALLLRGADATDCVQEAMAAIENDEEIGSYVVGRGGYPNKDGLIQCDAAVMEGHPCHFGAVAALSGVGTPLAVARKVMERNTCSFLVGDGAAAFAREQGFMVEDNESMMTERSAEVYKEYLEKKKSPKGHDTLGLIALDIHGNITVGVSTSGAPFKYPGRVGDSPLPGCGLYADNQSLHIPACIVQSRQTSKGRLLGRSCSSYRRWRPDHVFLSMLSCSSANETGFVSNGCMSDCLTINSRKQERKICLNLA